MYIEQISSPILEEAKLGNLLASYQAKPPGTKNFQVEYVNKFNFILYHLDINSKKISIQLSKYLLKTPMFKIFYW